MSTPQATIRQTLLSRRVTLEAGASVGAYRVIRKIGEGGMGAVYEVEHKMLHQRFALKTFFFSGNTAAEREDMEARFLLEARVTSQMHHTGIVSVQTLDRDEVAGVYYFVMEYIAMSRQRREELLASAVGDGAAWRKVPEVCPTNEPPVGLSLEDLYRYAKNTGARLNPELVRQLLLDVSDALAYAHSFGEGVIHRDIKPANILVRADGHAVIADFGVAKVLDRRLREGILKQGQSLSVRMDTKGESYHLVLGTVDYMAPELMAGAVPSPRTDLFALGVVAYQLLTGTMFEAGAKLPSEFGLPKRWDALILKCLYTEPNDRWQDLRAFHEALAVQRGGRLKRTAAEAPSPVAMRALAVAAVTALVCCVLGAGIYGLRRWSAAAEELPVVVAGEKVVAGRQSYLLPEVPQSDYLFFRQVAKGYALVRVHPDTCGVLSVPETYRGKKVVEVSDTAIAGCKHLTAVRLPEGVEPTDAIAELNGTTRKALTPKSADDFQMLMGAAPTMQAIQEVNGGEPDDSLTLAVAEADLPALHYTPTADGTGWVLSSVDKAVSGEVRIPAWHQGKPVVEIGPEAFYGERPISKVILPETIRKIGARAFRDSPIASVILNEGLEEVDVGAFYRMPKLTTIALPSTLKYLGDQAFQNSGLTSISFADADIQFNGRTFTGCSLTNGPLRLPEKVKSLSSSLFWFATLTEVELPGIEEITHDASFDPFSACGNRRPLRYIFGQKKVRIGERSIGLQRGSITSGCYLRLCFPKDAEVSFAPNFLRDETIRIERQFGDDPVEHWDPLSKAWVSGALQVEIWATTAQQDGTLAIVSCLDTTSKRLVIPEKIAGKTVSTILGGAFKEIPATELVFPESLTTIRNAAFLKMRKLEHIVFPATIKTLDQALWAMQWCESLKTATFRKMPERLPNFFFSHCTALRLVVFEDTSILPLFSAAAAFEDCDPEGVLIALPDASKYHLVQGRTCRRVSEAEANAFLEKNGLPTLSARRAVSIPAAAQPDAPGALPVSEPALDLSATPILTRAASSNAVTIALRPIKAASAYSIAAISGLDAVRTLTLPKQYFSRPVLYVEPNAFADLPDSFHLRLQTAVEFAPRAFPDTSPARISFPRGCYPLFSSTTFSGALPTFYEGTTKVSLLAKTPQGTFLRAKDGCWLYALPTPFRSNHYTLPDNIGKHPVLGILPDALRSAPSLKTLSFDGSPQETTLKPGALNGPKALSLDGTP